MNGGFDDLSVPFELLECDECGTVFGIDSPRETVECPNCEAEVDNQRGGFR